MEMDFEDFEDFETDLPDSLEMDVGGIVVERFGLVGLVGLEDGFVNTNFGNGPGIERAIQGWEDDARLARERVRLREENLAYERVVKKAMAEASKVTEGVGGREGAKETSKGEVTTGEGATENIAGVSIEAAEKAPEVAGDTTEGGGAKKTIGGSGGGVGEGGSYSWDFYGREECCR
ncbi:hypothetical protein ABW19_dt0209280 [Dactylella cylindrospora]|nr:hypothetical protein ABW19_dt0209280 [Dactylella cylindrospora]